MHEDWTCEFCGSLFQRRVGVPGRPQIYCRKSCRKRAAGQRSALHLVDPEKCKPWTGEGYEPWTGDDAGG